MYALQRLRTKLHAVDNPSKGKALVIQEMQLLFGAQLFSDHFDRLRKRRIASLYDVILEALFPEATSQRRALKYELL